MGQAYYEKRYSFSTHCFYGIEHEKNILFLCSVDSAVSKYFNPCVLGPVNTNSKSRGPVVQIDRRSIGLPRNLDKE